MGFWEWGHSQECHRQLPSGPCDLLQIYYVMLFAVVGGLFQALGFSLPPPPPPPPLLARLSLFLPPFCLHAFVRVHVCACVCVCVYVCVCVCVWMTRVGIKKGQLYGMKMHTTLRKALVKKERHHCSYLPQLKTHYIYKTAPGAGRLLSAKFDSAA